MKVPVFVLAFTLLLQNPGAQSQLSLQGSVVALGSNEPIFRATVELRDADTASAAPFVATSDRDGRFSFRSIPPGRYRVTAIHARHMSVAYGERRSGSPGEILTLSAGQPAPPINFVLTPAGVISGRIDDHGGQPAANATVAAWRLSFLQGTKSRQGVQSAITNDLGEYRLFGLAPGAYFVTATAFAGAPTGFLYGPDRMTDVYARLRIENEPPPPAAPAPGSVTFPDKADPFEGALIDVRPGREVRNVNLRIGDTVRTTRLRAMAVDSRTGQAVAGAQLNLVSLSGGVNRVVPGLPTTTADLGFVPIGSYLLVASSGDLSGRRFFEIKGEEALEVSVALEPGFNVTGRIAVEGMNAAEAGLAGLQIDLRLDVTIAVPNGRLTVSPQDDGSFVLSKILPGTYTIGVQPLQYQQNATLRIPPALQNAYVKSIRLGSEDGVNGKLHLDAAPREPIEIVISTNGATLEGRVVATEPRQRLDAITVVLAPDGGLRSRGEFFRNIATDEAGRFRFERIPPGPYKIFAWEFVENGAWRVPEFLRTDEDHGVSIQLSESGRSTIDVPIIPPR